MKLWIDTETYSETPIKYGTYRYTADCELMVVSWAMDNAPVQVWDRTDDARMPDDLALALHRSRRGVGPQRDVRPQRDRQAPSRRSRRPLRCGAARWCARCRTRCPADWTSCATS
jgi:hypothetical protein